MKDPDQQDMIRDLNRYKDALRDIQFALIELIHKIDMDTYQRDKHHEQPEGE